MKLNINECVNVTLTQAGLRRLRQYYADLGHDLRPPRSQDMAGRPVSFQLHDLMGIFGPMLYAGAVELPFKNNEIEIPSVLDRLAAQISGG